MSECEFCHEDFCIVEALLNKTFKKHPCKFAKGKILKHCTAKDTDLEYFDEDITGG